MRILITTFGSLGDLFPYLNISEHLNQAGHAVTIAANAQHRERVEAAGFAFHSVRPNIEPDADFFRRVMDEFGGGRYLFRDILFPAIRDSYEDLKLALPSQEVLVTHPATFAGPLIARETGIPWVSTVLAPISLFSRTDPSVAATALLGVRRRAPALVDLLNRFARFTTRGWSAPVLQLREELGQPTEGNPLFEGQNSPRLVLALFSKHFAMHQPDWPAHAAITGFPLAEAASPPPDIARFLDSGPPPIVFTLGSTAVSTPGTFFEVARSLGVRALLLAGPHAKAIPKTPEVLAVEYAAHSAIFPRAAAIVHQAGIGTTAEVLRSGRPSLVVPFAFDQPDNAARLERLGVARVVNRRAVNVARLHRELTKLLENGSYTAAALRLGSLIAAEDGAAAAAEAIAGAVN